MFQPNLGRWLQVDPIGFDGGDENLYRYEGNNPANATDPDGLQTVKKGENAQKGIPGLVASASEPVPSKEECFKCYRVERLNPADLAVPWKSAGRGSHPCKVVSLLGTENFVEDVPPFTIVGPMGAQPCVGVILVPPRVDDGGLRPNGKTFCFHFTATCDPIITMRDAMSKNCPARGNYAGYTAVLCGQGTTSNAEDNHEAAKALFAVCKFLDAEKIPIKYVPGPNAHVDEFGRIYWTVPKGSSLKGY